MAGMQAMMATETSTAPMDRRVRWTPPALAALVLAAALSSSIGRAADGRAADAPVLSFGQALERASSGGPLALVARSEREVAAARARQARAWQNPTLSVEVENVLGRGPHRDFEAAETTVSLTQPLPIGGGRGSLLRAARADEAAAEAGAALTALDLRRDLAIAYAEAVAADRLAAIGRERAALGAQTRAAVERRHAAGLESDLQRARVEVETAAMQAEARRTAVASLAHRRALAAYWREETVTAPLDDAWFDASPASPATGTPDGAAHPRLVIARARLDEARARLEAARGASFGGVEATVGTRRFKDAPDADRAWVLALSMPLPLWDRNGAGIAEARAALQAAELDAERAARDMAAESEAAGAEFEAARFEVEALVATGLPAAASAARLAAQGYEAGRLSLLERLDAERAWVQAREQLVTARLRLRSAEARLAAAQASSTER
jgi:cobalt-zinc-cadmium efflux system outer membrane protein